jgi:hypothetical protein
VLRLGSIGVICCMAFEAAKDTANTQ